MNYLEIKSKCSNCDKENQTLLALTELNSIYCEDCGFRIVEMNPIDGFVYVSSNEAFPTYLKVGFTERNVEERIQQLNSNTALPRPFVLEAYYYSSEPYSDEQKIHTELDEYRVSDNREFFELDIDSAINKISKLLNKSPYYLGTRLQDLQKTREEEKQKKEAEEKRREQYERRKTEISEKRRKDKELTMRIMAEERRKEEEKN